MQGIALSDNVNKPILTASIFVAISGILYGFLGYIGTLILQDEMDIYSMLFWRFFLAGVWLSYFSLRFRVKNKDNAEFSPFNSDQLLTKPKHLLWIMFGLGAIGYSGSSGFYFLACESIGTGVSMVVFYSYPILIALISVIFLNYCFSLKTLIALIAMTGGLILLQPHTTTLSKFNLYGILYAILAAISYAIYVLGSKQFAKQHVNANALSSMVCYGSAFVFFCITVYTGHFTFPLTAKSWAYMLIFAIVITAIPVQLMLQGLKLISSMRASIISVLDPIVTLIVGVGFLHETVTPLQWLGVTIILLSALLIQFQKNL